MGSNTILIKKKKRKAEKALIDRTKKHLERSMIQTVVYIDVSSE